VEFRPKQACSYRSSSVFVLPVSLLVTTVNSGENGSAQCEVWGECDIDRTSCRLRDGECSGTRNRVLDGRHLANTVESVPEKKNSSLSHNPAGYICSQICRWPNFKILPTALLNDWSA